MNLCGFPSKLSSNATASTRIRKMVIADSSEEKIKTDVEHFEESKHKFLFGQVGA